MPKFLIIRFSSIGDIVLTTPVVRCVKEQLGAEVHFLTKRSYKSLVAANPYVDQVHTIEKKVTEVLPVLRKEKFTGIIDLHKNLRTLQVKLALRHPSRSFPKLNLQKWLLVRLKQNRMPDLHIVDRYFEAAKRWNAAYDGKGLDYFIPAEKIDELDQQIQSLGIKREGYIALAIGAAHATKRMPEDQLLKLCQQIGFPIVLLGGPTEQEVGARLAINGGSHIINTCGQLSLHGSARVIQQASLVITHDTGMMHIAAAFKRPIFSIWGSTVPDFGMVPFYPEGKNENTTFEVQSLSCRPCSKIGFSECPKGHFDCMYKQDLEGIVLAALRQIGK